MDLMDMRYLTLRNNNTVRKLFLKVKGLLNLIETIGKEALYSSGA